MGDTTKKIIQNLMHDLPKYATSGIGSLPHHNIDAAIDFSFSRDVPFFPQTPIRNQKEFMITQSLDGMPGLNPDEDGTVSVDLDTWQKHQKGFSEKLQKALKTGNVDEFEPTEEVASCWKPFLFELGEREIKFAKAQIAGPLTSQWILKFTDGTTIHQYSTLASQCFELVLARALCMAKKIKDAGAKPIIFFDEPGLYLYSAKNPIHRMALQELKLAISTLHKEGVIVGLHCCSNTEWADVLDLGLDIVSMDVGLSLSKVFENKAVFEKYWATGGALALGVVPTNTTFGTEEPSHDATEKLFNKLKKKVQIAFPAKPKRFQEIMKRSLITPACGLGLHTPASAEAILEQLKEFHQMCVQKLG